MIRLFSLVAVSLLAIASARAGDLAEGDEAPALSLAGSDGQTHALEDYRDKQVVVLAWFPRAFTGGWTKECLALRESGAAIREFDVAYFTASCDDAATNKKFAESLELDYPILSDPEKDVARAYGVVHEGRDLPERWTFYIGLDGRILFVDKEANTDGHGEEIAAKLRELGVAEKSE